MKNLVIIGGGVFSDFGSKRLRQLGLSQKSTVLWGIGTSRAEGGLAPHERDWDEKSYLLAGLRDKDRLPHGELYLPCVSALHEMLDEEPKESRCLVFLNADPKVTSAESRAHLESLAKARDWLFLTNDCNEEEFRELFEKASHVVTNSYHGAYWSWLSGRQACVLGHSSKFESLFLSLDLPKEKLVRYQREESMALAKALEKIEEGSFLALEDSKKTLASCRDLNQKFAERLQQLGGCQSYQLKCPKASQNLLEK